MSEDRTYTPASPAKRILAWVGIAYMVIIVLLNCYALATGEFLHGIGWLMICPAALGLIALVLVRSGRLRGLFPSKEEKDAP